MKEEEEDAEKNGKSTVSVLCVFTHDNHIRNNPLHLENSQAYGRTSQYRISTDHSDLKRQIKFKPLCEITTVSKNKKYMRY